MSTGGIFQLITNDGKQDKLLMATELLNRRLLAVKRARAASGLDPTPTLADIEKTHVLFTNAHFKPFAAIASEYNKVQAKGIFALGQDVQFNIPQFGDFFSDMVLHVKVDAARMMSYENATNKAPHKRARSVWAPWLGERLIQKASFTVNGNPLDEYNPNHVNVNREFFIKQDKLEAYKRCIGQESKKEAYLYNAEKRITGVNSLRTNKVLKYTEGLQTPKLHHGPNNDDKFDLWIPLQFWFNKDFRLAVPSVAIPYGQRFINITLAKSTQIVRKHHGHVPLWQGEDFINQSLFNSWCDNNVVTSNNDDTYGELNGDNIELAITLYINNLFVNPEIHEIFIKRVGFNLIRVHLQQNFVVNKPKQSLLLNKLKWPIETLYVGLKMRDYNSGHPSKDAKYMDRWHSMSYRKQKVIYPDSGLSRTPGLIGELKMYNDKTNPSSPVLTGTNMDLSNYPKQNNFSYAIEKNGKWLTGHLKVVDSIPASASLTSTNKFEILQGSLTDFPSQLPANNNVYLYGFEHIGSTKYGFHPDNSQPKYWSRQPYIGYQDKKTLDELSISLHGIDVFKDMPCEFFNSYVPYQYGGPNVCAPQKNGWNMINFCLYPGAYQPSGHINASRAREFYIKYSSSIIGTVKDITGTASEEKYSGELIVLASALNFLLISDGSAVLRYST